jgi:hypothetical protein
MAVLIETRHIRCQEYRQVASGWSPTAEDANRLLFLPQASGGVTALPSDAREPQGRGRALLWQLDSHTTSTLQLTEVSLSDGQIGRAVQLAIPSSTFAAAAVSVVEGVLWICLLTNTRSVLYLQLPASKPQNARLSILDAITPQSLREVHLPQQLSAVGVPSSLTITDGCLCVSGSLDLVCTIPLAALLAQDTSSIFLLHTTASVIQRWMGSLVSSSTRVGAAAAFPCSDASNQQLLLLLHDDATLRAWSLTTQQQLLSVDLSETSSRQFRAKSAIQALPQTSSSTASNPTSPSNFWIFWQLDSSEGASSSIIGATQLSLGAGLGQGNRASATNAVVSNFQLELPMAAAALKHAVVYEELLVVLLGLPQGPVQLCCFSSRDGSYLGEVQLLQGKGTAEWGISQVRCFSYSRGFNARDANGWPGRRIGCKVTMCQNA